MGCTANPCEVLVTVLTIVVKPEEDGVLSCCDRVFEGSILQRVWCIYTPVSSILFPGHDDCLDPQSTRTTRAGNGQLDIDSISRAL